MNLVPFSHCFLARSRKSRMANTDRVSTLSSPSPIAEIPFNPYAPFANAPKFNPLPFLEGDFQIFLFLFFYNADSNSFILSLNLAASSNSIFLACSIISSVSFAIISSTLAFLSISYFSDVSATMLAFIVSLTDF